MKPLIFILFLSVIPCSTTFVSEFEQYPTITINITEEISVFSIDINYFLKEVMEYEGIITMHTSSEYWINIQFMICPDVYSEDHEMHRTVQRHFDAAFFNLIGNLTIIYCPEMRKRTTLDILVLNPSNATEHLHFTLTSQTMENIRLNMMMALGVAGGFLLGQLIFR